MSAASGVAQVRHPLTTVCTGEDIHCHEENKYDSVRPPNIAQIVGIDSRVPCCPSEIIDLIHLGGHGGFILYP
jgi:hypothetical protein